MRIMLVGGAVRDILLGRPVRDKDYMVTGTDERGFLARYPQARKVGKAFGVLLMDGVEVVLPRGRGVDEDLGLRDLTVNAMALDEDGELYCHPKALEDMAGRILRPCSTGSLASDPARIFRAARMTAELPDFSPHADLVMIMRRTCWDGLTLDLAPERIAAELMKALAAPKPSRFFELLADTACLSPWFAEIDACQGVPAGPETYHKGDVFQHLMEVADALAGDPMAVWMGVVHDLGKAMTDPHEWPSHHGHDTRGEGAAARLARRLGLPGRFIMAGRAAARRHMTAGRYPELKPGTRVDLLTALDARNLAEPLFALVKADHGEDHWPLAKADLEAIRAVTLPEEEKDKGPESGRRLRELKCLALAGAAGDEFGHKGN